MNRHAACLGLFLWGAPALGAGPPAVRAEEAGGVQALRGELDRLRAELAALQQERTAAARLDRQTDPAAAQEVQALRQRVQELLARTARRPPPARPTPPAPPAPPAEKAAEPADPLERAAACFQKGDHAAALNAYLAALDQPGLTAREFVEVKYLIATCLRRQGHLREAESLYGEIAVAETEPALADCARWQLDHLGWRRRLEAQVRELQRRGQALEGR